MKLRVLKMTQKVDINHVPKFDGSYFNTWKHRLTLVFKIEKLWSIVSSEECLLVEPTAREVAARIPALPTIGVGSI